MKKLLVVPLLLMGAAMPAWAQHSHPVGGSTRVIVVEKPLPVVPAPAGAVCIQQSDVVQIIGAATRLRLSTDQLVKLQSIEMQLAGPVLSTLQEAEGAYARAGGLLKSPPPDWAAYEAQVRVGAEKMIAARMAVALGDANARHVLSAEQLVGFDRQRQSARAAGIAGLACLTG